MRYYDANVCQESNTQGDIYQDLLIAKPIFTLDGVRCSEGDSNKVEEEGKVKDGHSNVLEWTYIGLNAGESN